MELNVNQPCLADEPKKISKKQPSRNDKCHLGFLVQEILLLNIRPKVIDERELQALEVYQVTVPEDIINKDGARCLI
jgi:hypothetical protein